MLKNVFFTRNCDFGLYFSLPHFRDFLKALLFDGKNKLISKVNEICLIINEIKIRKEKKFI